MSSSASRSADVFLPNWALGKPAALDVSIISPLQSQTVAEAALLKGHALNVGENRKLAAHQAECSAEGLSFIPLIVEALGGVESTGYNSIH